MNIPDNKRLTPQRKTLTVDGKEHSVTLLPIDIQTLVGIYDSWEKELSSAKIEVFKLEAAIRGVLNEIEHRVQQLEIDLRSKQDQQNKS